MSAAIEFACPHCQRKSRVAAQLAGKQARCPGCRKVFEIPRPAADDKSAPPKPRKSPQPVQGEEQTALAPAPTAAKPVGPGLGATLRSIPPPLLLALLVAVLVPGLGAIPCAAYALRSEPGTPEKKWGRVGLGLAVFTMLVHFTLLSAVAPPKPGTAPATRRLTPGG